MLKSRLPLVEGEGGDKTRDNTQTHTRASESTIMMMFTQPLQKVCIYPLNN